MVSSKDVAARAGVSQTTVSRVLNTPELVKKPTVDKVMKAIEELSYVPNGHARSLVQNKTNTIALISGPLHNPFFVDTTSAIVKYANELGYRVHVQFINDEQITEAYAAAIENKVDGVILSCILLDDPIFDKLKRMQIPFITYNRKHKSDEWFVEIDNYKAGYLAAQHVINLGHQHIVWIGGPLSVSTYLHRYKGFNKAIEDNHLSLADSDIFITDTSIESMRDVFQELTSREHVPTAICAGSDSIALDAIDIALQNGLNVPEDVSIIGIDNVGISKHQFIQLTTVGSISEQNLGLVAIKRLIELIENKENSCIKHTESVKLFNRKTVREV
ncbi:LacI family DNA-binding transcriptional regulator [Oceanobacillus manasiensis]|uniref:LacI family DNA-binding transcriptional regulator n=1 Tax=Oceanobacillus manasiensis TaxID=586413 RepID=UPI0005A84CDA|nr:LacI family DNA-binding transcriptional regulator [Oceanobacillus manasiensis]